MEHIPFYNIRLGGFWQQRQKLNKEVTVPNVYKRFKETGRFDAFRCDWKEGEDFKPHIFWDSDVAKWLESVGYLCYEYRDPELEKRVDETVDLIEKNQGEDGYFNIYYTVCEPDNRFTNRMNHELYCAGHLIEGAVAYYEATGKRKFLDCMEKYALYIKKVFVDEDSAKFSSPGHEELELALVKLWKCTGKDVYLELARHFVNVRGTSEKDFASPYYISQAYAQSHIPVREMREAVGHSVRACYLYSAMADLAAIDGDEGLKAACEALFDDIAYKKMYITGGIGSARVGEAFSESYDLPNSIAYTETCAAIALALFARRMSLYNHDSKYADIAERALYNGIISGYSLDGKSFFYENPLEINLREREMTKKYRDEHPRFPITQRVEVFGCSCCPPNITRFIASIGDFLYSTDDGTLFIHQYAQSEAQFGKTKITQITDYPHNGKVTIKIESADCRRAAVRIPSWCTNADIKFNGKKAAAAADRGYVYFELCGGENTVEIDFNMQPVLIEANPLIENNFGRAALQYGPIVYCLEGVDNKEPLRSLAVSKELNAKITYDEYFKANVIEADGIKYERFDGLYRPFEAKGEKIRLKFIPYFAFANRGESDMLVWVRVSDR